MKNCHALNFSAELIVVDGKIVSYSEIKDLPSSKIVSMTVLKNKDDLDYIRYSKDAIKYGKLDSKCIIKITTNDPQ